MIDATIRKSGDFYLAAFDFEAGETVNWTILTLPEVPAKSGSVTLDAAGAGRSPRIDLPNGQYKLTWLTDRAHGVGKFKVFQVDCPASKATPTAITPNGGPPAGGGGIARAEAFTPVAGAAAVGLAAVAGTVWFRLRRRPDGAA
ncbi:LPXTG cell wall anchor domain-containing protein OS=Streptomyces violarus OX=67380 GN=FHS41_006422 PE=4 SV=1 [Streptomyces violarus]